MSTKAVRITSPVANFRRGGIAHPAGATEYPIDQFTEEQLQQIIDEPLLALEEIDEAGRSTQVKKPAKKSGAKK